MIKKITVSILCLSCIFFAMILIISCGKIREAKYSKIQIGMSQQDVKGILGEPDDEIDGVFLYGIGSPPPDDGNKMLGMDIKQYVGNIEMKIAFMDNKVFIVSRNSSLYLASKNGKRVTFSELKNMK